MTQEMEMQTKKSVFEYMEEHGYKKGSHSYQDYEYAKVYFLGCDNYGSCCTWIADYLKI